MMDHEPQQIPAMMHVQVIKDRVDALHLFGNLFIDPAEKVDEVFFDPPWIALGPALPCRLPQYPVNVAFCSPSIVNRLRGSVGRASRDVDQLLTGITLG